jgi:hypothetical protein
MESGIVADQKVGGIGVQCGEYPQIPVVVRVGDDGPEFCSKLGANRRFVQHLELVQLGEPLPYAIGVLALDQLIPAGRVDEDSIALFHGQTHESCGRAHPRFHLSGEWLKCDECVGIEQESGRRRAHLRVGVVRHGRIIAPEVSFVGW